MQRRPFTDRKQTRVPGPALSTLHFCHHTTHMKNATAANLTTICTVDSSPGKGLAGVLVSPRTQQLFGRVSQGCANAMSLSRPRVTCRTPQSVADGEAQGESEGTKPPVCVPGQERTR